MAINDVNYIIIFLNGVCTVHEQYLPVYYLGHLVDVLRENAFEIDHWLASHNIHQDNFFQTNAKISMKDFDSLLKQVLCQPGLSHIGLTVGRKLQIAHHGTFGLALLNCQTVEQIIAFVQKYLVIRIPFIEISIIVKDDQIIVLAKDTYWQGSAHRFVIEAVSGAMFNIFKALQEKIENLQINSMFFDYTSPEYVDKYDVFAPTSIAFEHGYCGLAINQSLAKKIIPDADKLSFLQAQQACQTELDKFMQYASVKGRVHQILMNQSDTRISLSALANTLNMSQRTLHRRLQEEQTSFKQIVDEHQAGMARECLLVYGYTVSQTSYKLGYLDIANFRRAFKRWFRCTPSQFIAQGINKNDN